MAAFVFVSLVVVGYAGGVGWTILAFVGLFSVGLVGGIVWKSPVFTRADDPDNDYFSPVQMRKSFPYDSGGKSGGGGGGGVGRAQMQGVQQGQAQGYGGPQVTVQEQGQGMDGIANARQRSVSRHKYKDSGIDDTTYDESWRYSRDGGRRVDEYNNRSRYAAEQYQSTYARQLGQGQV